MKKKILAAALIVAVLLSISSVIAGQYREYGSQIEELQEGLADRERTIAAYAEELDALRTQVAGLSTMEESCTETGFPKKGGFYLIDNFSQLDRLSQMIRVGAEIEPGISAAEASYRLRADIYLAEDLFSIGTEAMPFCGRFDGDGHWIHGKLSRPGDTVEALFQMGGSAEIAGLYVADHMRQSFREEVSLTIDSKEKCAETEKHLKENPDCQVRLTIRDGELDTQAIAAVLRERWERGQEQDGYHVSASFIPEDHRAKIDALDAMVPFQWIAGEEWGKVIEETVEQEGGDLLYIHLERVAGVRCCTFGIGTLDRDRDYWRENDSFHILIEGEWEGRPVPLQHLSIPYTQMGKDGFDRHGSYHMESVDINFDGAQDLLIQEGVSGGSGGSWENYRAMIWDKGAERFAYYPSFPEQLAFLEFGRQRVISRGRCGSSYDYVTVYGVVDGVYVCTEELILEHVYEYDGEEEKWTYILSYYKMGKLVRTHILSSLEDREWEQLYPDLDYWLKG